MVTDMLQLACMCDHSDEVAAELIARIREASGYSQTELARRSGLDRSVLSAYENGRRQPSVAALARIAAAAGMKLDLTPSRNAAAEEHAGRVPAHARAARHHRLRHRQRE